MQRKRSQWIETISGANAEHQIYLDESGINTNLTRHYAHAVHGKRAIDIGIANAGDGKLIPVDGFKGVHAQLDAREEFRHGFLDGNFLFYRFPGFLRILVILSGSERKSYVSAGKVSDMLISAGNLFRCPSDAGQKAENRSIRTGVHRS